MAERMSALEDRLGTAMPTIADSSAGSSDDADIPRPTPIRLSLVQPID